MLGRFARILFVDESAVTCQTGRSLLARIGYSNVDVAYGAAAALERLQRFPYRLVIANYDMAPKTGLDLLRAMRADERWRRMPFLMATTRDHKKFFEIARDEGVTHYIVKPYTAEMLAERIAQVGQNELV